MSPIENNGYFYKAIVYFVVWLSINSKSIAINRKKCYATPVCKILAVDGAVLH
jgi:hypothetical protein